MLQGFHYVLQSRKYVRNLSVIEKIVDKSINYEITNRRPGDPAQTVADIEKSKKLLNWVAEKKLDEMISSAWNAWLFSNSLK